MSAADPPPDRLTTNRDRGEPHDSSPPTPPYVRVRIRRFGGLCEPRCRDGSQAEGTEEAVWQCLGKRGAVCEPPKAMWAAGGVRRPVPAATPAAPVGQAGKSTLRIVPGKGA